MIPNHVSPKLSELDLMFARSVPPGGNWKDIPESVPSQRLKQIRESFARGEGSRSTYYGRLISGAPAYTISTYFGRPGNGCHLHFDASQNRTLSYREAARLQSFPDSFVFTGPYTAIAKQIGNAVPPLLAYWCAMAFGKPGILIDLFAGAGGLSLGFHWAGWKSVVASDIDEHAMATFAKNIHKNILVGDIRAPEIRSGIIKLATAGADKKLPRVLVGGPPCQGFSTAGNRRSRDDHRNHLFKDYCALVEAVAPDAFLFENVTGLLNMEGGAVFTEVLAELKKVAKEVRVWRVSADEYGIPQRRKRVIIVGFRTLKPFQLATGPLSSDLFGGAPVSVGEALSDLPALIAGQDGSGLMYRTAPQSPYQHLMRGEIDASAFVGTLSKRFRSRPEASQEDDVPPRRENAIGCARKDSSCNT
ncbi:MAG TPA: DNA (cytosine-5-)-methyltransferase [Candidatus Fermentibacter daniensis]|nr:DNA (cytosine-5-)-methyltransferase [Candidatus Fermentibacter daniensis]HPO34248.1 DNA (cytosine-5-)-methyltransferase [Deltaproteobacteria bacterium]